ncbi:hypothetical protein ES703_31119 [subsurface metagenome]
MARSDILGFSHFLARSPHMGFSWLLARSFIMGSSPASQGGNLHCKRNERPRDRTSHRRISGRRSGPAHPWAGRSRSGEARACRSRTSPPGFSWTLARSFLGDQVFIMIATIQATTRKHIEVNQICPLLASTKRTTFLISSPFLDFSRSLARSFPLGFSSL